MIYYETVNKNTISYIYYITKSYICQDFPVIFESAPVPGRLLPPEHRAVQFNIVAALQRRLSVLEHIISRQNRNCTYLLCMELYV